MQVAMCQRDLQRDVVRLKPLREFEYPADMPQAPSHLNKSMLLQPDTEDDNELVVSKLKEIFDMPDDEIQNVVGSLRLVCFHCCFISANND